MNEIISGVVMVACFAFVIGGALYGVNAVLGEWSTLLWMGLILGGFFAVCRRINA